MMKGYKVNLRVKDSAIHPKIYLSFKPSHLIGPEHGCRKTLTMVSIEPMTFGVDHHCYSARQDLISWQMIIKLMLKGCNSHPGKYFSQSLLCVPNSRTKANFRWIYGLMVLYFTL